MFRRHGRHLEEHRRQHGKHYRLDKAHENLEGEERQWHDIRHQVENNREQYFSGKNIAEETEGEREDLGKFRNQLDQSNHSADAVWLVPGRDEELGRITAQPQSQNTGDLDGEHYRQRKTEREVEVGRGTTKERDDGGVSGFIHVWQTNSAQSRQQSRPVRQKDEQKNRSNEWEKLPGHIPILHDAVEHVDQTIDHYLEHILHPPRHRLKTRYHRLRHEDEQGTHDRSDKKRVGHRERSEHKQFFRRDRYFHTNKKQTKKAPSAYFQSLFRHEKLIFRAKTVKEEECYSESNVTMPTQFTAEK